MTVAKEEGVNCQCSGIRKPRKYRDSDRKMKVSCRGPRSVPIMAPELPRPARWRIRECEAIWLCIG
jgi:hypothetical protein